jgi:hypothetical protein
MKEGHRQDEEKKRLKPKAVSPGSRSRFTPKERDTLRLVAGLFLLGWLVRACRMHDWF